MPPNVSSILDKIAKGLGSFTNRGDYVKHGDSISLGSLIPKKQVDLKVPITGEPMSTAGAEPDNYTVYDASLYDFKDKAPFPREYLPYVEEASSSYEIEPSILASLLASETGGLATPYNPNAESSAGAYGISQIIPGYHYQKGGYQDPKAYQEAIINDPAFAISEAGRILREYLDMSDSNYYDALSAYNAGYGNIEAGRGYAQEVLDRVNYPVNNIYD